MSRRPLESLVTDVVEALDPRGLPGVGMRVTTLQLDLPVEISLRLDHDDLVLEADVPRWRWRSAFDRAPGRLTLTMHEEVSP